MDRRVRVFIGISAILFGSFQIWKATQPNKAQQKQEKLLRDLSIQQMEERNKVDHTDAFIKEEKLKLDSIVNGLEDVKNNLDEIGERLKEMD